MGVCVGPYNVGLIPISFAGLILLFRGALRILFTGGFFSLFDRVLGSCVRCFVISRRILLTNAFRSLVFRYKYMKCFGREHFSCKIDVEIAREGGGFRIMRTIWWCVVRFRVLLI